MDGPVVVMPLAGEGRRFREAGYPHPKYLLPIRGKTMLEWAITSLNLPHARYLFVVRREHFDTYPLEALTQHLVRERTLIALAAPTDGAACTVLAALHDGGVSDATPLYIANCDQWLTWDPLTYEQTLQQTGARGGILVTPRLLPAMSFAAIAAGRITQVAEKVPISPWATCGVYHFVYAGDFRRAAHRMIAQNRRVRGEFYVCPVYNELLEEEATILPVKTEDFWSLGTPEDVDEFRMRQCRP